MHFVILSPTHEYHTGDWFEDAPVWSPKLDRAYAFMTKELALETVRQHIDADRAAERTIGFTGCRVVELDDEKKRLAMKELRARGYRVGFNESCTCIWIDFDEKKVSLEKAIATFPREIYGMPTRLRGSGKPIAWDHKRR